MMRVRRSGCLAVKYAPWMAKTPARAGSRYAKILQSGAELFYERGFAAVGVDEIGERAGVTGPAIYRHFNGKDEILATLFDDAIDRLVETTAGEFDDPREELTALVRGHAQFVLDERRLAGVKIREERSLAEPYNKRLRRRERRYVDRWIDCVRRCYPDQDHDELLTATHAAIGMLNSIAMWPREALRADGLADVIVAQVLNGFSAFDETAGRTLAETRSTS